MGKQNKYDRRVKDLVRRLIKKGYNAEISHVYSNGELDVKVIRNHHTRYYEVKSNYNDKSQQHARNQFRTFLRYYNFREDGTYGGKCIYISYHPDGRIIARRYKGISKKI